MMGITCCMEGRREVFQKSFTSVLTGFFISRIVLLLLLFFFFFFQFSVTIL